MKTLTTIAACLVLAALTITPAHAVRKRGIKLQTQGDVTTLSVTLPTDEWLADVEALGSEHQPQVAVQCTAAMAASTGCTEGQGTTVGNPESRAEFVWKAFVNGFLQRGDQTRYQLAAQAAAQAEATANEPREAEVQ